MLAALTPALNGINSAAIPASGDNISAWPIKDRREREQSARRRLIVSTARRLAEAEGWDAVTTRRLAAEIEYSQPVLYKHFAGMEQIAEAVALDGFGEFVEVLGRRPGPGTAGDVLARIAHAYLDFARDNPALYDAMFTRATTLRFAAQDTPPQLTAAFTELRQALVVVAGGQDVDALTEVFWAGLHGLVTLTRAGRLRPGHDAERLDSARRRRSRDRLTARGTTDPAAPRYSRILARMLVITMSGTESGKLQNVTSTSTTDLSR